MAGITVVDSKGLDDQEPFLDYTSDIAPRVGENLITIEGDDTRITWEVTAVHHLVMVPPDFPTEHHREIVMVKRLGKGKF